MPFPAITAVNNACFITFFHNIGPNLVQIFSQDHTHFRVFFAVFQWNMLGNSILQTLNWNPVVLKKCCWNLSKLRFLVQLVQKRGSHGPRPKQKFFFSETTKPDKKLSKPSYLTKYISYVLADSFSILCDAFFPKSFISSHESCELAVKKARSISCYVKTALSQIEKRIKK